MTLDPDLDPDVALVDPHRCVHLCDVGLPGHSVAVAVDAAGREQFWIVDDGWLDDPDHAPHGCARSCCAPHDQLGGPPPTPAPPPRCGRPTATTGRPCRNRVTRAGQACGWHRRREAYR